MDSEGGSPITIGGSSHSQQAPKPFSEKADNLRQQTLHQLHRILTVRQAAKCCLVISEYYSRLRALSSLLASRPREQMMSDENSCQTTTDLKMEKEARDDPQVEEIMKVCCP